MPLSIPPAPIAIAYVCLSLCFLAALVRVLRGPQLPDRLVALDFASLSSIALLALHALVSGRLFLLDVAVVIGLISFVGVLAFAQFLERGGEE